MIARLSDLAYTRLYGRDRTCTGCGRDYGQDSTRCPNCKSPASTLTDRTAPVGSRPC
jgi:predicted amidophosphoribosyltransferase